MRIRTIKPEFWAHPIMSRLPYDSRILALGLLNLSDDEGYFDADPDYIRGAVLFREDSSNVRRMLDELSRSGWIILCGSPERPIGRVINFRKHQRVDRPQPSRLKQYALDESSTNDRRTLDDQSTLEQGKERNTPIVPKGDIQPEENSGEIHSIEPNLARAKAIFRKRPTTPLDPAETRAWRKVADVLEATTEPEWLQLEAYYAADLPAKDDYRRRDLATLLNNWSGELTRAAAYCDRIGWQPEKTQKKEEGPPPDEVWREVLRALYPESDPAVYSSWAQVPDSLRAEILQAIALAEKEAA